jgi:hypothetical protein
MEEHSMKDKAMIYPFETGMGLFCPSKVKVSLALPQLPCLRIQSISQSVNYVQHIFPCDYLWAFPLAF